jgi:hypothetical protein
MKDKAHKHKKTDLFNFYTNKFCDVPFPLCKLTINEHANYRVINFFTANVTNYNKLLEDNLSQ